MRKSSKLRGIILIIIGLILFGVVFFTDKKEAKEEEKEEEENIINVTEQADIESITIYGRFFNIEGSLANDLNIESIKFIIYNKDKEYEYEINNEIVNEKIFFSTNQKINEGVI